MGEDKIRGTNESEAPAGKAARRAWTRLEKALLATTVLGFAIAGVAFALLAGSYVPPDAAAKVDDFFVSEGSVAERIEQQRVANGAEDDSTFAVYLLQQGMNVYTYRQSAINEIALDQLIENRAADLGVSPTAEQVDALVSAMRERSGAEDDGEWIAKLEEQGMTEESLRAQLQANQAEQNMYEADVPRREATDEEVASFVRSNRAGGADKHSWRMTFTGDGAKERAESARARVEELGDDLDAESFSQVARDLSESPTVGEDGGDAGWTYMDGSTTYAQALAGLREGELSGVLETDNDGNYGFAYCDEVVDYPESDDMDGFKVSDLPEDLAEDLRQLAGDDLWQTDCNVYLTALLADADITYYPIPDGAVYDIDMKLAAMALGEALDDDGGE